MNTFPGDPSAKSQANESNRGYGFLLIGASVVMVTFMAMHPTVHVHDPESFVDEMTGIAHLNNIVHGSLIATMGLVVLGLSGLCSQLGWRSMLVRGGFIAYVMGALGGMFAAITNGFVVGLLMEYTDGDADTVLDRLDATLSALHVFSEICSQLFVIAASVAVMAWSINMLLKSGGMRIVGVVGLTVGILPLALLLVGHLRMNVHGFGLFVLLQAVWYISASVLLIRARV